MKETRNMRSAALVFSVRAIFTEEIIVSRGPSRTFKGQEMDSEEQESFAAEVFGFDFDGGDVVGG
jgi:hypothetical protein